MNTPTKHRILQLEKCFPEMFGDLIVTCQSPVQGDLPRQVIQPIPYTIGIRRSGIDSVSIAKQRKVVFENDKRRASVLVDELLMDIYYTVQSGSTDYNSTSGKSHKSCWTEAVNVESKEVRELRDILGCLRMHVERMGSVLVRRLKRRDALRQQQEAYSDVITKHLLRMSLAQNPADMRFTIQPLPGETGFSQWVTAMKMVAQLPGGIPQEFRKRLWITMADKHLTAKGVNWSEVERTCFSEWSHPADAELGVQIVKDLHRTGCSLFCGEDGQENQALLKRVLLAYARWNKAVGYCQGFNMLAALILQVTDRCETDALKLMIYLIEGVLPDSYFADSLRGLSVDMAVFRELLRSRLPRLSRHLDRLQTAAKDGSRSYEPPLTNVFTMQWFLTLFCNCLPHPTVLRVWDLILLEGNEILLRTALAIWQVLADRIMGVRSADEFYGIMGILTRELLEFDLVNANALITAVVTIGPLNELKSLREHYMYNINPWGTSAPKAVDKQLKLYTKQSIALDISALKKQYTKLRQRQRQAHIIFSAAITKQPPPSPPVTMNHLLIGKSALVPAKRLGPIEGSIPPARRQTTGTLHWKDAEKPPSSSSSSDTELCDDHSEESSEEEEEEEEKGKDDNLLEKTDEDILNTTVDNNTSANSDVNVDVEDNFMLPSDNQKHESDEENFEFERFLSDRVTYLGEINLEPSTDDFPEERVNFARRNSERALQIIQENSLILHRIMHCQARYSPSPPMVETTDHQAQTDPRNVVIIEPPAESRPKCESSEVDEKSEEGRHGMKLNISDSGGLTEKLESPVYGSRYTSILEKSKSLDEKYNALILNIPKYSMGSNSISSISEIRLKEDSSSLENSCSNSSESHDKISSREPNDPSAPNLKTYPTLHEHVPPSQEIQQIDNPFHLKSDYQYLRYLGASKSEDTSSGVSSMKVGDQLEDISPLFETKELPCTDFNKFYSIVPKTLSPVSLQPLVSLDSSTDLSPEYLDALKESSRIDEKMFLDSPLSLPSANTCYNYLGKDIENSSDTIECGYEDRFTFSGGVSDVAEKLTSLPSSDTSLHYLQSPIFSPTKSPSIELLSQNFNPFPVSISNVQNKDIEPTLNLYMK